MPKYKMGTKKKKTAKRAAPKRRRVGASGKIEPILMNVAGVGAGIAAMRELSILAGQFFPSLMASPIITGIVEMGVGGLVAYKAKNGFLLYMGLGGAGNGLMTVLNGAGVIGGPPQTMSYNFVNRRQMGDPRLQFVAGPGTRVGSFPNNFNVVAGAGMGARKPRYTT